MTASGVVEWDVQPYEVAAGVPTGSVSALRLEGLLHESLPRGSAGRSFRGNVILTELRAEIASGDQPNSWQPVKFRRAWADLEVGDSAKGIASAIDGKTETGPLPRVSEQGGASVSRIGTPASTEWIRSSQIVRIEVFLKKK